MINYQKPTKKAIDTFQSFELQARLKHNVEFPQSLLYTSIFTVESQSLVESIYEIYCFALGLSIEVGFGQQDLLGNVRF